MSAMAAGPRPAPGPSPRPVPGPARRRAPLRVLERAPRRIRASFVAAAMVVASLLTVVVGHSVLAQGQVRLAAVQAEVTSAGVQHRQAVQAVATLETPSRIVADATRTLHMVPAVQVQQLPFVPLSTPLPVPHVAP
ncbi:MAG: hypothetical protein ACRDY3_01915 [Acidimicrobiales bacterium]